MAMRLPPSVLVMSAVTAVPFGLGIREQLRTKQAPTAAMQVEELSAYEAQARSEAAARDRMLADRAADLAALYGPKPAMPGSGIGGIEPGDQSVSTPVDEQACSQLSDQLEQAWGPRADGEWTDDAAHIRARLEERPSCKLTFERFLEPPDWIELLPLDAVGKPIELYTDRWQDDSASWRMPGLASGLGTTRVEATIAKGRVVRIQASASASTLTIFAVRDLISSKLKTRPRRNETGGWLWKGNVSLQPLENLSPSLAEQRFAIAIGKQP